MKEVIKIQCPHCGSILQGEREVRMTTDLVCEWSSTPFDDKRPKVAGMLSGTLFLNVETEDGKRAMLSIQPGQPVKHLSGEETKWVLREIAPGVRKLYPSILSDQLHCFLTIVGCPPMETNNVVEAENKDYTNYREDYDDYGLDDGD